MRISSFTLAALSAALLLSFNASAQKKPLDHSVYDGWQSIGSSVLSDDGKTLAYVISPQEGDAELVITKTDSGKELRVGRGGTPTVSKDGKWAVFTIKAPFAETRKAKIAKKKGDDMPKDTVAYVNLETLEMTKISGASSFRALMEKSNYIVYQVDVKKPAPAPKKDGEAPAPEVKKDQGPGLPPPGGRPGPAAGGSTKVTVILNPDSGQTDTLKNVGSYTFDKDGERMAVVFKQDKKDSLSANEVVIFRLPSMEKTVLSSGKKYYSTPNFNLEGDKAVFLASIDSNATGNKHCAVYLYEEYLTGKGKKAVRNSRTDEIIPQTYSLDKGLCVTENSNPSFSKSSGRLLLSVSECRPPKDTTIIDFETAQLDIWNWNVYQTPPMQKRMGGRGGNSFSSVINLDEPGKILVLTDSKTSRISYIDGADNDIALMTDNAPYQISSTWDSNGYTDVCFVNLRTGEKKELFTKLNGSPSISPAGRYLTWFDSDELDWMAYRIADGVKFNMTENIGVPFYDEEDDHPDTPPSTDRPHWIENDEAFLLSDKFDIWKISPDGKTAAVNLTKGQGREGELQLSYTSFERNDIPAALQRLGVTKPIGKKDVVTLTVFNRVTKENGYAQISVAAPGFIKFFTSKNVYQTPNKAKNADIIAFKKGDYNNPYDQYYTTDFFASSKKLSSINPQQADYNWGNIQLVHWTAYDGTKLDGLLVTPENLDPSKKYPMMVYFYEKYSESLYSYRAPAPSRSTVNIPFFASRGYVVFIPDIVYKDGHPGESAYNCICSGAEAMCDQFSFVDRSRMAIQGQSWGGYQTAYLVTRTDMFAAAGAGAPVGNMTSAYGGIRWESGMVRAMQYEHGQSRIGKSLWDEGGLDLYIENSPVFHTQNVTTPVLIMANDADGAVPWYQGIEYFMSLRRFGHPAWLLTYNDEEHNLSQRRNAKDLSVRLSQFFDHYLLGDPMPAWMKYGVPYDRKGEYFGFEMAE